MTSTVTRMWDASPEAYEALQRFQSITGQSQSEALNQLVTQAVGTLLGEEVVNPFTVNLQERWLTVNPETPVFHGRCFRWPDSGIVGAEMLHYKDVLAKQILFRLLGLSVWNYRNGGVGDGDHSSIFVSPMAATLWCERARSQPGQMGHWRYDVLHNVLSVQFTAELLEGHAREQMIAQLRMRP